MTMYHTANHFHWTKNSPNPPSLHYTETFRGIKLLYTTAIFTDDNVVQITICIGSM